MSSLSQFNSTIHQFVQELYKMNILKSEVRKLKSYVEITHISARTIIQNFQKYILRDEIVYNILTENVEYFLNYDLNEAVEENKRNILNRITPIVRQLVDDNDLSNITTTFSWMKILCFHAYTEIGIDANEKFKSLYATNQSLSE
tara:strand:- start:753 stop:1187 length:435 start_codon:yes stop_codon:yes gene_type:complete